MVPVLVMFLLTVPVMFTWLLEVIAQAVIAVGLDKFLRGRFQKAFLKPHILKDVITWQLVDTCFVVRRLPPSLPQ